MINLEKMGQKAKEMSKYTGRLDVQTKNEALLTCAEALEAQADYILAENKKDMDNADPSRGSFNDRLLLTPPRISAMAEGLRKVSRLDDPAGEVLYMKTLTNGLQIGEQRVPLGVIGMIYEARPNVTVDAFGLCFKAGNSCILRGGSEAICSNIALVSVLQGALEAANHPREVVQFISDTSREVAKDFMKLNKYVDVLIPRGSASLINSTVEHSKIPVIETGVGNCHIYVDDTADLDKAVKIIINAKTQRISVCNACEKLLVHKALADTFLTVICKALSDAGVEIRGDSLVCNAFPKALPAAEGDWYEEYLDMIIGIKVVNGLDEAIAHINHYSSGHSDVILTEGYRAAKHFVAEIDSAAVYVNASSRFTDGEEFGLGAEIGISTGKLHARGPMGLKALTTTKFIVFGNGQVRP
ncbi:MAG: glutamate-5-semialdehyde dehydrogenase [Defluviitaleaceae bacterium]|nr:glutamate-5-semialdehyde dehydrogenase [Defluviitaleaceae bacterium]